MKKQKRFPGVALMLAAFLFASACPAGAVNGAPGVLQIEEQGSFAVGGGVITSPGVFDPRNPANPAGQSLHSDHAYVFYQKPVNARKYPLVFLHGAGQFSKTWESTPDGREGFQNIFLRKGYAVYLVDQPRRGDAGRGTLPMEIKPTPDEQMWFTIFRLGIWPDFYPGVQFPQDAEALDQFFRQMTPNTGPYDDAIISDALAALFGKTGGGVLVTHSQGGGPGWYAAIKNPKINAVISYEPGLFLFPEGEVPAPIPGSSPFDPLKAGSISLPEFERLARLPIVLYFGDNIPDEPSDNPGQDNWRTRLQMARLWVEAVNRHGGDATLVHLPKIGVKGNTHFPFSDLNNLEIAELMEKWLAEKKLR
jgi:pimeloyl-ACP methyl ester carboxylesterase